jgi:hypothetical protein
LLIFAARLAARLVPACVVAPLEELLPDDEVLPEDELLEALTLPLDEPLVDEPLVDEPLLEELVLEELVLEELPEVLALPLEELLLEVPPLELEELAPEELLLELLPPAAVALSGLDSTLEASGFALGPLPQAVRIKGAKASTAYPANFIVSSFGSCKEREC